MHRGNRVCDRFRAAWEVHLGAVETSRDPVMSLEDLTFQSEEEEGEWEWEWGGYAPPNSRRSSSDSDEPAYLELLFLQGLLMQFDRIYLNNRLMDREAGLSSEGSEAERSSDSESEGSEVGLLEGEHESLMDNLRVSSLWPLHAARRGGIGGSDVDLSDPNLEEVGTATSRGLLDDLYNVD
ncbi:uncharacterized protein LOC144405546 [Gasterosteus aculeatus]